MKDSKKKNPADFLFEAAVLKRLKRTGWQILGANEESVAEHSFLVTVISFVLAGQLKVKREKILLMSLFHDFPEARTGDIYKLADLYLKEDGQKAISDSLNQLPISKELVKILEEYEKKESLESKIVHDADSLALCLELKILIENGNLAAREWFEANLSRLVLAQSKALAKEIQDTNSQNWWKEERAKIHRSFKR